MSMATTVQTVGREWRANDSNIHSYKQKMRQGNAEKQGTMLSAEQQKKALEMQKRLQELYMLH